MLNKKFGFTLTEVLLAVSIVGIIAALVLPGVITKYQETVFESKYNRIVNELNTTLQGLAVMEGETDFCATSMHLVGGSTNYDITSGAFLKKYFKLSRYCGKTSDSTALNNVIKGQCFADTYYEYDYKKDNDNKIIEPRQIVDKKTFSPDFGGACAVLKNGASICLTHQDFYQNGIPIEGHIDVNGPKGPNILGKDLRKFKLKYIECKKTNRTNKTKTVISY